MMKTRTKTYEGWNYKIILAFITMMLCLVFAKNNVFASNRIDFEKLETLPIDGTKTAMKQLTDTDYCHYYMFTIPQAGEVKITLNNYGGGRVYWDLYNQEEYQLKEDSLSDGGNMSTPKIDNWFYNLKQGTYYLCLSKSNSPYYKISVTYKSLNCSTGNNDSILTAEPVKLDSIVYNMLTYDFDTAWYKYDIPQTGEYYFDFYKTGCAYDIELYDSNGKYFDNWVMDLGTKYRNGTQALKAGTLYVKVIKGDAGPYKFKLSAPKTVNKTTSSTQTSTKAPSVVIKQTKKVVKYTTVVKKKVVVYINTVVNVTNAKVSYKLKSCPKKGKKYIKISKKGKVTFKKKAPRGVYKIKVSVKKTASTRAVSKIVKIRVK